MKRKHVILCICLCIALTVVASVTVFTGKAEHKEEPSALSKINVELGNLVPDGDAELVDAALFEKTFQQQLVAAKSDSYVYLLEEESLTPKAVICEDPAKVDSATKKTELKNMDEAVETARKLAEKFMPVTASDTYGVLYASYNEGMGEYDLIFRSVTADGIYYGKSIAVTLNKYGTMLAIQQVDNGAYEQAAVQAAKSEVMSESDAIEQAYKHITAYVTQQGIGQENPLKVFTDSRTDHGVTAYKEIRDNQVIWNLEISNITTNKPWTKSYWIRQDAITGELIWLDESR